MSAHRAKLTALGAVCIVAPCTPETGCDPVIEGGRVMDPESGLDGARNIGIRDGSIAAVSADALGGERVIDATGLVVAPGGDFGCSAG